MPNKYCPAGKIECENYLDTWGGSPSMTCMINRTGFILLPEDEQCRWPSKQKPIAPVKCTDCKIFKSDFYTKECFECGFAAAKQQAVEAVQKIYCEYLKNHEVHMGGGGEPTDTQSHKYLGKAIVAISAIEVKHG